MLRSILALAAILSLGFNAQAATSADEVLERARMAAVVEKKAVLLKFDSPGCGWCKLLDQFLDSPEIEPVFRRYFVTANLRIPDIAGNPGALKFLQKTGGMNQGTPFYAFLKSDGTLIVNSLRDGKTNIGFPESQAEIKWLVSMLQKAAPGITEDETRLIEKRIREFRK